MMKTAIFLLFASLVMLVSSVSAKVLLKLETDKNSADGVYALKLKGEVCYECIPNKTGDFGIIDKGNNINYFNCYQKNYSANVSYDSATVVPGESAPAEIEKYYNVFTSFKRVNPEYVDWLKDEDKRKEIEFLGKIGIEKQVVNLLEEKVDSLLSTEMKEIVNNGVKNKTLKLTVPKTGDDLRHPVVFEIHRAKRINVAPYGVGKDPLDGIKKLGLPIQVEDIFYAQWKTETPSQVLMKNGDFWEAVSYRVSGKVFAVSNYLLDLQDSEEHYALVYPAIEWLGKKYQFAIFEDCGNPAYRYDCPECPECPGCPPCPEVSFAPPQVEYRDTGRVEYRVVEAEKPCPEPRATAKLNVDLWSGSYDCLPQWKWVGWYGGGQAELLFGRSDSPWSFGPKFMDTYWRGISRNFCEFRGYRLSFGPIIDYSKGSKNWEEGVRFNFSPQWGLIKSHDWRGDTISQRQKSYMIVLMATANAWNEKLSFESYVDASLDVSRERTEGSWMPVSRGSVSLGWKFFFLHPWIFRLGVMNKEFYTFDDHGWTIAVGPVVSIWDVAKVGCQWDWTFDSKYGDRNGRSIAIIGELSLSTLIKKIANKDKAMTAPENYITPQRGLPPSVSPEPEEDEDVWKTRESLEEEVSEQPSEESSDCGKFYYVRDTDGSLVKVCE